MIKLLLVALICFVVPNDAQPPTTTGRPVIMEPTQGTPPTDYYRGITTAKYAAKAQKASSTTTPKYAVRIQKASSTPTPKFTVKIQKASSTTHRPFQTTTAAVAIGDDAYTDYSDSMEEPKPPAPKFNSKILWKSNSLVIIERTKANQSSPSSNEATRNTMNNTDESCNSVADVAICYERACKWFKGTCKDKVGNDNEQKYVFGGNEDEIWEDEFVIRSPANFMELIHTFKLMWENPPNIGPPSLWIAFLVVSLIVVLILVTAVTFCIFRLCGWCQIKKKIQTAEEHLEQFLGKTLVLVLPGGRRIPIERYSIGGGSGEGGNSKSITLYAGELEGTALFSGPEFTDPTPSTSKASWPGTSGNRQVGGNAAEAGFVNMGFGDTMSMESINLNAPTSSSSEKKSNDGQDQASSSNWTSETVPMQPKRKSTFKKLPQTHVAHINGGTTYWGFAHVDDIDIQMALDGKTEFQEYQESAF